MLQNCTPMHLLPGDCGVAAATCKRSLPQAVTPANAGGHSSHGALWAQWIPAFAGMTRGEGPTWPAP